MHDRKAVSAKKLTQPRPHEGRVGRSADIFSVMSPGRRSSIEKHKKYMLIHDLRCTARGHEKTFVRTTFVRPDRTPVWPEKEPAWFDRALRAAMACVMGQQGYDNGGIVMADYR